MNKSVNTIKLVVLALLTALFAYWLTDGIKTVIPVDVQKKSYDSLEGVLYYYIEEFAVLDECGYEEYLICFTDKKGQRVYTSISVDSDSEFDRKCKEYMEGEQFRQGDVFLSGCFWGHEQEGERFADVYEVYNKEMPGVLLDWDFWFEDAETKEEFCANKLERTLPTLMFLGTLTLLGIIGIIVLLRKRKDLMPEGYVDKLQKYAIRYMPGNVYGVDVQREMLDRVRKVLPIETGMMPVIEKVFETGSLGNLSAQQFNQQIAASVERWCGTFTGKGFIKQVSAMETEQVLKSWIVMYFYCTVLGPDSCYNLDRYCQRIANEIYKSGFVIPEAKAVKAERREPMKSQESMEEKRRRLEERAKNLKADFGTFSIEESDRQRLRQTVMQYMPNPLENVEAQKEILQYLNAVTDITVVELKTQFSWNIPDAMPEEMKQQRFMSALVETVLALNQSLAIMNAEFMVKKVQSADAEALLKAWGTLDYYVQCLKIEHTPNIQNFRDYIHQTIFDRFLNNAKSLKLQPVKCEGQAIYIDSAAFLEWRNQNAVTAQTVYQFNAVIPCTEKEPVISLYDDGMKTREYRLETENDEDFTGKYFQVSVLLHVMGNPAVPVAQIDGFISDTAEERNMTMNDIGYRMEGYFLVCGGETAKQRYEMTRGQDLPMKALKYQGRTTPSNVRLIGICPDCGKSFAFHGYAFYMGQSDVAYSDDGLDVCEIVEYNINPETWSYEEDDKTFRYYNSFNCPHCQTPYIDYKKYPENKVFGVSGCVLLGRKHYRAVGNSLLDTQNEKAKAFIDQQKKLVHPQIEKYKKTSLKLSDCRDGWNVITYFCINKAVAYVERTEENRTLLNILEKVCYMEDKMSGYDICFYRHRNTEKIYVDWYWFDASGNTSRPPCAEAYYEISNENYEDLIKVLKIKCQNRGKLFGFQSSLEILAEKKEVISVDWDSRGSYFHFSGGLHFDDISIGIISNGEYVNRYCIERMNDGYPNGMGGGGNMNLLPEEYCSYYGVIRYCLERDYVVFDEITEEEFERKMKWLQHG